MSAEQKVDVWSSDLYKINQIMISVLPTFLDQNEKINMLNVCPRWNKMLQNKLFWKGKFVLSNTRIKRIALNDRQKIHDEKDDAETNGFTKSGIAEIYEHYDLISRWIKKMKPLLKLVTVLVVDLIPPKTMRNHDLTYALNQLVSVATIKTLEIVSISSYIHVITYCAPTLNNLILNVRDEYYRQYNLHISDKKSLAYKQSQGPDVERLTLLTDEQMHSQMIHDFRNFLVTHELIQFPRLLTYKISIGLTSLESDKYKYLSLKRCIGDIYEILESTGLPNLKSFGLHTETGSNYHDNNYFSKDSLKQFQTKCSNLEEWSIKCLGMDAYFAKGKLLKFGILSDVNKELGNLVDVEQFIHNYCTMKQIEEGKLTLDNIDLHCSVLNVYYTHYDISFFEKQKELLNCIKKITIRCDCKTSLVMHKQIKSDIDAYKIENPSKEVVVISNYKKNVETTEKMRISCQNLHRYITIGELLQADDDKSHAKKLHIDIECEYCQSGEGCNYYKNNDGNYASACFGCWHSTDCTKNIIQFMISQPSTTSYALYFNHKVTGYIEDMKITSRVRKIMEASLLHNIDVKYYSLFKFKYAYHSKRLFPNYKCKLDKCCISSACKDPITIKKFPNGLKLLDFFETKQIEFTCDCEIRSKSHHREQINNIKEFTDDKISICVNNFNIKCCELQNYFTKGDLEYFYTKDNKPIHTINIICDCNPKCNIEEFIKENESNDIKVAYVVKENLLVVV